MTDRAPEEQIPAVAGMSRGELIRGILRVRCTFPNDLTPEYMRGLSLERLRHIYMALLLHAGDSPKGGRRRRSAS